MVGEERDVKQGQTLCSPESGGFRGFVEDGEVFAPNVDPRSCEAEHVLVLDFVLELFSFLKC